MKKYTLIVCAAVLLAKLACGQPRHIQLGSLLRNIPTFELQFPADDRAWNPSLAQNIFSQIWLLFMLQKIEIFATAGRLNPIEVFDPDARSNQAVTKKSSNEAIELYRAVQLMRERGMINQEHTDELSKAIEAAQDGRCVYSEQQDAQMQRMINLIPTFQMDTLPRSNTDQLGAAQPSETHADEALLRDYIWRMRTLCEQNDLEGLLQLAMEAAQQAHRAISFSVFFDALRFIIMENANIVRLIIGPHALIQTNTKIAKLVRTQIKDLLGIRHVDGLARLYGQVTALYNCGYISHTYRNQLHQEILGAIDQIGGIQTVSPGLMMLIWGNFQYMYTLIERFSAQGTQALQQLHAIVANALNQGWIDIARFNQFHEYIGRTLLRATQGDPTRIEKLIDQLRSDSPGLMILIFGNPQLIDKLIGYLSAGGVKSLAQLHQIASNTLKEGWIDEDTFNLFIDRIGGALMQPNQEDPQGIQVMMGQLQTTSPELMIQIWGNQESASILLEYFSRRAVKGLDELHQMVIHALEQGWMDTATFGLFTEAIRIAVARTIQTQADPSNIEQLIATANNLAALNELSEIVTNMADIGWITRTTFKSFNERLKEATIRIYANAQRIQELIGHALEDEDSPITELHALQDMLDAALERRWVDERNHAICQAAIREALLGATIRRALGEREEDSPPLTFTTTVGTAQAEPRDDIELQSHFYWDVPTHSQGEPPSL